MSPQYDAVAAFDQVCKGRLFGTFAIFQTNSQDWYEYSSISTALITMKDDALPTEPGVLADTGSGYATGEFKRTYIYNNNVLQFNRDTRLISLLYYDVQPKPNLQDIWASIYHKFSSTFSSTLAGSQIESTEYRKTQDLREKLPPSSYKQAKLEANFRVNDPTMLVGNLVYGQRDIDKLKRSEVSGGVLFTNFISNQYSASILAGVRKNFGSSDVFGRLGFGRYSRMFETTVDYEYASETDQNKKKLHPSKLEFGLGMIMSSRLFATLAVQQQKDEEVNILSGLLRVATRFGNKDVAPVRAGAPARGRL